MTRRVELVTLVKMGDTRERRLNDRVAVVWDVDCVSQETFLYAAITNISAVGIFVSTLDPLDPGTAVALHFAVPETGESFELSGIVEWINPVRAFGENRNPGMGVSFINMTPDHRERLVSAVHTIAYVRERQLN